MVQSLSAKKKVLLIDDERYFCFFIAKNLEHSGEYTVIYATNPDKGIRMAKKESPDVILLDISMPGKDGFKVLEILKGDEKTLSIPVIMLTALDDEEARLKASSLYNEDYVTKPVSYETLKAKIDKALEGMMEKRVRLHLQR